MEIEKLNIKMLVGAIVVCFFFPALAVFLVAGMIVYSSRVTKVENKTNEIPIFDTDAWMAFIKSDPNFSERALISFARKLLIKIQESIQDKDLTGIKHFLSSDLYEILLAKVNGLEKVNVMRAFENQEIVDAFIRNYIREGAFDYIVVRVKIKLRDFTLDARGKVVEGSANRDIVVFYDVTLKRSIKSKTSANPYLKMSNCPSCGGALEEVGQSKCHFCGSVLSKETMDWAVDDFVQVPTSELTHLVKNINATNRFLKKFIWFGIPVTAIALLVIVIAIVGTYDSAVSYYSYYEEDSYILDNNYSKASSFPLSDKIGASNSRIEVGTTYLYEAEEYDDYKGTRKITFSNPREITEEMASSLYSTNDHKISDAKPFLVQVDFEVVNAACIDMSYFSASNWVPYNVSLTKMNGDKAVGEGTAPDFYEIRELARKANPSNKYVSDLSISGDIVIWTDDIDNTCLTMNLKHKVYFNLK